MCFPWRKMHSSVASSGARSTDIVERWSAFIQGLNNCRAGRQGIIWQIARTQLLVSKRQLFVWPAKKWCSC
jgi:hypothetical protein